MKRLLWAVAGVAWAAGAAWAEPPAGKERTPLEQEFHLADQPTVTAAPPGTPRRSVELSSFASAVGVVRQWVFASVAGRLDVARNRPEVW